MEMPQIFKRFAVRLGGVAVIAASAGCLQADKTLTLYIAADGTVTWMAVEKDVRSDDKDAAKAAAEEQQYILRAKADDHAVARAFQHLNASSLTTLIVRDTRPFFVLTSGQFVSMEALGQAVIDAAGLHATSVGDLHNGRRSWMMTIYSDEASSDGTDDFTALADQPWRVVLEKGCFVAAEGFSIEEGGRVAVQLTDATAPTPDRPLVWSLTWVP